MIASQSQSDVITINVFTSIPSGKIFIKGISTTANAWRHSIRAEGGFWDGGFSLRGGPSEQEEWLQNGLYRHVEVCDEALNLIWEGFVNKVTVTYGAVSVTYGPLLDMVNDVQVVYTKQRETDSGVTSSTKYTAWKRNIASAQKWNSVFQRVLNAGALKDDEAVRIRDMYAAEHAQPELKQDISTTRHETNIVVECAGYVQLLDRYVFQADTPNSGADQEKTLTEVTASAKIKMALAHDPNSVFTYTEKLGNPKFEIAGTGSPDILGSWTDTASDGAIAQVQLTGQITTNYHARLQAGASYNTEISQAVSVVAGKSYPFVFTTQGNKYQGRYKVHITSTATNIIPIANTRVSYNNDNRFIRVGCCFTVPAATTSLTVTLYCPYRENAYVWYDDASFPDYTQVDENSIEVTVRQKGNKTAWAVIKQILTQGDSADNRWLFGVYKDRVPHYHVAPNTSYEYTARTQDNKITFYRLNGEEVKPYNILPGKWVLFTDLLVGTSTPSDLRLDPRAMFIEEARYSGDEGLTLNSGRISQLTNRLGRLGITI